MSFTDRPQQLWWRKALFQVHLWAGVLIGLYVIAVSLSGSMLVFQREFENDAPRLGSDTLQVAVNYDEIVRIARSAHPGEQVDGIDLRSRFRRVVPVLLRGAAGERIVYVDSHTNTIVGDHVPQEEHRFTQFLMHLHNELLMGHKGAVCNGLGGLALVLMCLSGIVLWWPGKKNWKRVLKVKWNARLARVNWDMHSAFGFWTLLFVIMWGATGAYFIWPRQIRDAVAILSPMPHMREKTSDFHPDQSVRPLQTFVDRALNMYPQSQLAYVYMDVYRPQGMVKVFLSRDPGQSLTWMEDVVSFHPATMDILSDISTSRLNPVERASLALYSIHFGDFGGLPGKIVWCIAGLVPAVLTVTGYLMWWNRVLKKRVVSWNSRSHELATAASETQVN